MITGSGLSRLIVQVCVTGSKPGTGTLRLAAVEAGISKTMLSTPGLVSALAFDIAWRKRSRAGITRITDNEVRAISSLL